MIKIQFISVQTLKDNTIVQQNVDEKNLNISIREFQDIELRSFLGFAEYERIEAQLLGVQSGEIDELTPEDAKLMEQIRPVCIYGALLYSIPNVHTKFTATGSQEDKDLNADRASKQDARADQAFKLDAAKRAYLLYRKGLDEQVDSCASVEDTTFNFTGTALRDSHYDYDKLYQSEYYKTGGGRIIVK